MFRFARTILGCKKLKFSALYSATPAIPHPMQHCVLVQELHSTQAKVGAAALPFLMEGGIVMLQQALVQTLLNP